MSLLLGHNCKNSILISNLNPSRNAIECLAEGTGNFLSEEQLRFFQVRERCLLDMYKDNPVTRKVKIKDELNRQQDSLKFTACKSNENSESIGK